MITRAEGLGTFLQLVLRVKATGQVVRQDRIALAKCVVASIA
jgi:hypothetical protein